MALDTSINRFQLIHIFPDLNNDNNFHILSPDTPVYNCIAWAMGYDDRWVSPEYGAGYWWPAGVKRSMSSDSLIKAFEAEGFERANDNSPEEGYDKVVLYKQETTDNWTHAAKIVDANVEYSKFGEMWDGQHSHNVLCNTGKGYENQSYGIAYAYMRRKIQPINKELPKGNISVDIEKLKTLLGR